MKSNDKKTTANKELFESSEFLLTLFNAVPSYVFIVDSDVRIYHFNSAAKKLLNSEYESVFFKKSGDLLHCVHSREIPDGCGHAPSCKVCDIRNSVTEAFRNNSVYRRTTKMLFFDKESIHESYFAVTASPFDYKDGKFVLLVLEDITKEKNLEHSLRLKTAQLEVANKEMEAFSWSVSHDLGAPLRHIDGFSELLIERYGDVLDDKGKKFLSTIRTASKRMAAIIEGLLKLSRISRTELHRKAVDLSAIARDVSKHLYDGEPNRTVKFAIQDHVSVPGDPSLLHVLMENLIGNAWKYTSRKERAKIEFGTIKKEDSIVYFVRDNGDGFDMEHADKIFTPFRRLHTQDEFPGAGIGLATVKRIVESHGGRIWAEAKKGQGAVFCFTLSKQE